MDFMSGTGEYAKFLPLVVFLARIADVSLGTLRINFVARGFKFRASLIGFIEQATIRVLPAPPARVALEPAISALSDEALKAKTAAAAKA